MKKLVFTSLLISSFAHANISTTAIATDIGDNDLILPITLNNQANVEISSHSDYIPLEARKIPAQEAVVFELKIPNKTGIKRIRYSNADYGCDFYIDILNHEQIMPSSASITAVPINANSMCNVFTTTGVNHLAVSFVKN